MDATHTHKKSPNKKKPTNKKNPTRHHHPLKNKQTTPVNKKYENQTNQTKKSHNKPNQENPNRKQTNTKTMKNIQSTVLRSQICFLEGSLVRSV